MAQSAGWRLDVTAPLLLLSLVHILVCLALTRGGFSYGLDDAYIHLAMAGEIAQGGYGVNHGEFAAAASSPLWPFLLVPFAWLPGASLAPLLLNLISATLLCVVIGDLLGLREAERTTRLALGLFAALAFNLVGLVLIGMEHSLQILWTALLVAAVARHAGGQDRFPNWLPVAVLVAPLIRYELLAVAAMVSSYMLLVGRWRLALLLGAAAALPVAAFSGFLAALGLPLLPVSVMEKLGFETGGGFLGSLPGHVVDVVMYKAEARPVILLSALLLLPLFDRRRAWRERAFALAGMVIGVAHVMFGRYGWAGRYEVYAVAAPALVLAALYRAPLLRMVERIPAPARLVTSIGLPLALVPTLAVQSLIWAGMAMKTQHDQQYQLHRFATEFLKAPIAVNDIGWVAFQNQAYVLDLWGLANQAARQGRLTHKPGWMDQLVRAHDVHVAVVYPSWFTGDLPSDWIPIARMVRARKAIAGGDSPHETVTFYATDRESVAGLVTMLDRFAPTLPSDVRLERMELPGSSDRRGRHGTSNE